MNDPQEGKTIFEAFDNKKINDSFDSGMKLSEFSVYIGSFLPAQEGNDEMNHEDELVMWRTYGKDENKTEAAGSNLVIDSSFFDKEENTIINLMKIDKNNIGKIPQVLYNVIYYKAGKFANDEDGSIKSLTNELNDKLSELLKFKDKNATNSDDNYIDKKIFEPLSEICYFFKSSDYSFENESRIVHYVPLGNEAIKTSPNLNVAGEPELKLYIESNNEVLPYVYRFHLGPKVPNHSHWSAYFDYLIRKRKKTEGIEHEIEVRKSQRNFQ